MGKTRFCKQGKNRFQDKIISLNIYAETLSEQRVSAFQHVMGTQKNNWKILTENVKYDNPWIKVTEFDVITPGGTNGIYGKVHFKNLAIGIIPIDKERNIYLIGQYRFVLEQYSWEIPEGGGLIGIDPLISAKRELKEETGLEAAGWTKILEMHLSNSVSDELSIVYLATDLTQGVAEPEETEELDLIKIPFEEAYQKVLQFEITDSMTVAAILKLKIMFLENDISNA